VGPLGALDGAIQLRGAGRQDEQAQASLLAGLLEFSGELAAIDLHGSDGERHPLLETVEKLRGGSSGRTRVRLQNAPARDHIARGEVFPDHAGDRAARRGDRPRPDCSGESPELRPVSMSPRKDGLVLSSIGNSGPQRFLLISEILELPLPSQYPIGALSESVDKPDQSICARPEFPAFNFRKLSLADPKKGRKFFLEHSTSELPDT
jgi:hypothetical protein